MEPFFFEEAEAVADHERRMRREQEEARKEEQRLRAVKAHWSTLAKISDYDPKQGVQYYNRYNFADFSRFDIDEECKSIDLSLAHLPSHLLYCSRSSSLFASRETLVHHMIILLD